MFTELKHTYDIDNSFRDKTGLTTTEFLKTLNVFWISVLNSELTKIHYLGFVTEDHISVMHSYLGQEKTDLLINLLTVSRENIKSVLIEDRALKNYDLQIFETSFFCKTDNQYEFLDQKRKRKVMEMKKLIHKFDITPDDLGLHLNINNL